MTKDQMMAFSAKSYTALQGQPNSYSFI